MSMHIYKITNRINKKSYIGLTTAVNPIRRFNEHKSKAKYSPNTYLERAISKYGARNFSFRVLKSFNPDEITLDGLLEEEVKSIKKNKTLTPNGYNVLLRASTYKKDRNLIDKITVSLHKNRERINKYKGVSQFQDCFRCEIRRSNKRYCKTFINEKDAAEAYDMMSILLYNDESPSNFPNKKYSKKQLDRCWDFFNSKFDRRGAGKYFGVSYDSSRNSFCAYYLRPKTKRKFIKRFKTPELARDALKEEFSKNGLIYNENGDIKEVNQNA